MNIFFKSRSKSLNISERDSTYKVKYLGNVLTAFMKGEGCVDRPTGILWNNYLANENASLDMELTVCASGLKVVTKEQGLTEYRSHRISYCVCHPQYPKMFVWVYRHEGKKMKVELRCHAVLCKTEEKAKAIAVQLHDKLSFALLEFTREKTRRQNSRLVLHRANSVPSNVSSGTPLRTKFLTTGTNFKPPVEQSTGAPKLDAITEGSEDECVDEQRITRTLMKPNGVTAETRSVTEEVSFSYVEPPTSADQSYDDEFSDMSINPDGLDMMLGNDIDELKGDVKVQRELLRYLDSDSESIESGFSEQDGAAHEEQSQRT